MLLFSLLANSQIINLGDPEFKGKIQSVKEYSKKFKNDWREFVFDSAFRLNEKKSYRENNLLEVVNWTYLDLDSVLIVNETINGVRFISKSYFDNNKRLKRYESYSSVDLEHPSIIETDVVYENNQIEKYKRILLNNRDTTIVESYLFKRNRNNSKVIIKKAINNNIDPETITFKYDKKGNLVSKSVNYNNPKTVLGGVKTWSSNRKDKYRIDYKYDNFGNWIKSYSVTRYRKYNLNERELKYNNWGG